MKLFVRPKKKKKTEENKETKSDLKEIKTHKVVLYTRYFLRDS